MYETITHHRALCCDASQPETHNYLLCGVTLYHHTHLNSVVLPMHITLLLHRCIVCTLLIQAILLRGVCG